MADKNLILGLAALALWYYLSKKTGMTVPSEWEDWPESKWSTAVRVSVVTGLIQMADNEEKIETIEGTTFRFIRIRTGPDDVKMNVYKKRTA